MHNVERNDVANVWFFFPTLIKEKKNSSLLAFYKMLSNENSTSIVNERKNEK